MNNAEKYLHPMGNIDKSLQLRVILSILVILVNYRLNRKLIGINRKFWVIT